MTKEAFLAGFVKEGQDLGLGESQILGLFEQAINYPPFRESFDKMASDGQVINGESLNTIANLSSVKQKQQELESAGAQSMLNNA